MGGIIGERHHVTNARYERTNAQREMKGQLAGALPKNSWLFTLLLSLKLL